MFKLFKKENHIKAEVTSFLQQEKNRRKQSDEFVRLLAEVIPYVAVEVWGQNDDELDIGADVVLQLKEKKFYLMDESKDMIEEVSALKGQLYWRSVQEIMNYAKDMIEDIQERDAGRNQLVTEMASLTQQMKDSPIVSGMKARVFRV
ncbi:hypothetical protein [Paenibacillus senegalimassiliensis]|uniref:hypothetical protein n=1 Tax=Paenibacillus senegalimassiliensis TaxID=1737426 RepID=UPI00073E7483|nr:hypothetical protein [Paenibacillus senegalimassiliensis]